MNRFKNSSCLMIIVTLCSLVACGDKTSQTIPPLPDFDENTEAAVVETIKEHHKTLTEAPTFKNMREYAKVLQAHRREKMAVEVYNLCLEMEEDFECLYLAGRILKRNDPKVSREYLEKAIKIRSDYAPLYLDYCESLELAGMYDEAIKAANKSLSMESSPLGYYFLGRNLLAAGKPAEAIPALEKANYGSPGQKSIMNLLARAYAQTNQQDKADAMAEAIAKESDDRGAIASDNLIMRSVILKGRSYQSMLSRVVGALNAGRFDKALEWADQRIEVKPEEAANYALRGDANHGMKRYGQAVVDFEKSSQLDPKNALIRLKLSKSLVMAGRINEGFKQVVKARQLNPKDPETRFYYAYHVWQTKPKVAVKELRVSLRMDPTNVEARTLLAKVLFVLGQPIEAREEIKKALALSPNNSRIINLREEYKDAKPLGQ